VVAPNPEILRADASLWQHRGRFRHHQSCAADGAASQVDQVPVVRKPVRTRVLAHRRDEHTIGKRDATNGERIKEMRHGSIVAVTPWRTAGSRRRAGAGTPPHEASTASRQRRTRKATSDTTP